MFFVHYFLNVLNLPFNNNSVELLNQHYSFNWIYFKNFVFNDYCNFEVTFFYKLYISKGDFEDNTDSKIKFLQFIRDNFLD